MKILDKYIIKQLAAGLLAIVVILVGIAWLSQILRLIDFMVNKKLSIFSFLYFTSLLLPNLTSIVLPIALFAVILFTYNKLISDKEIVVMQAIGMGVKPLSKPVMYFAVILTLFNFLLNLYISPKFAVKFKEYKWDIANSISTLMIKEGTFNEVTKGLTVYINKAEGNTLLDIFINDKRSSSSSKTIMAEKGQIVETDTGVSIVLVNGNIQEKNKSNYGFGGFSTYTVDLGLVRNKETRNYKPKELSLKQLFNPESLGIAKSHVNRFKMEAHKRLITPFYNIMFALLALIGLFKTSLNRREGSKFMFVTICIMLAMQSFYIMLFNFVRSNIALVPLLYLLTLVIIILEFRYLYYDKVREV